MRSVLQNAHLASLTPDKAAMRVQGSRSTLVVPPGSGSEPPPPTSSDAPVAMPSLGRLSTGEARAFPRPANDAGSLIAARLSDAGQKGPSTRGPHAIRPTDGVLRDENIGANAQGNAAFGRAGYFSTVGLVLCAV